ncbi:MAG: biopolymer transporter ExbD [Kiritimatiellae bacterium]|nr:biopolymer transporter ExbD [Kiritimatiellia bacterium]
MNFRKKQRARPQGLQMTALMDVIFLLLCFFVATSVFSQWEAEIAIALPSAKSATVPGRMPGEIILNVSSQGVVTINGQVLTLEDLTSRLSRLSKLYPGQPVVIRADKETSYESLVAVIDACRTADVWNFSLATKDEDK